MLTILRSNKKTSFGETSYGELHLATLYLAWIGCANPFPGFAKFSTGYAKHTNTQTHKHGEILYRLYEIYNFNIAVKNTHKDTIRDNNYIYKLKHRRFCGVRSVVILTVYVSPLH